MVKSCSPTVKVLKALFVPFPPITLTVFVSSGVLINNSKPSWSDFKISDFFTISKTPFVTGLGKTTC